MYTHRKRLIFLIVISTIAYFYSQAQDGSSERTPLEQGAWALQFGIGANFTLTSFQGTTIALKYQLSDKSAIRGGITISGSTSNGNNTASGFVADTSYGAVPENSSADASNVSFVLQYLWYMNPSGPVHFYLGLGPSVSYSYANSSSDNSTLTAVKTHGYWVRTVSTSNSRQWGIGGTGVAGVEWFANQWLSIRAEYSEGIQYQWRSAAPSSDLSSPLYLTYVPTHSDVSGTTKGWSLTSGGVSFGLSIYW